MKVIKQTTIKRVIPKNHRSLRPDGLSMAWPRKVSFLMVMGLWSASLTAQDYSVQVKAFEQSFTEKSVVPLETHISPQLKFDPIPVENTPAILNNIVTNLPLLKSLSILSADQGKADVKYDFEGLGVQESAIHFDDNGKIVRIELIENLIKQEMEAQKRLKESVQIPEPGELGLKYPPKTVTFKAADGLMIEGDLYEVRSEKPIILLCHQAGYNRFEYADIAPRLNEMGYNCLAIDQRSGGNFGGKSNVSTVRAIEKKLPHEMVDARDDISAAISFLYQRYQRDIVLWGSSYSASLALMEGASNNKVKAIIAFSPGDYFGKRAPYLVTVLGSLNKPFLVTSSKEEAPVLRALIGDKKLEAGQSQFTPQSMGFHGSKALWNGQMGREEYWASVISFLNFVEKHAKE